MTVEELRQGVPIVIQDPVEMLLVFGVLLILGIPFYLSVRRRSFRRTVDDRSDVQR